MLSRSELMVFISLVSFWTSVTSACRLSCTNVFTVPTESATACSAFWISARSETRDAETPARSLTNARTSLSLVASVSVNWASSVTVSNSGPAPSPNVAAAAESWRIISLPRWPWPSSAFAPASSRWLRVPSLLTPLGPSASARSRMLA